MCGERQPGVRPGGKHRAWIASPGAKTRLRHEHVVFAVDGVGRASPTRPGIGQVGAGVRAFSSEPAVPEQAVLSSRPLPWRLPCRGGGRRGLSSPHASGACGEQQREADEGRSRALGGDDASRPDRYWRPVRGSAGQRAAAGRAVGVGCRCHRAGVASVHREPRWSALVARVHEDASSRPRGNRMAAVGHDGSEAGRRAQMRAPR